MGVKYLYYHCQQRSCSAPVNIRAELLHDGFLEFIRQHQPNSDYLRLFHKVVTDVWNNKQADAVALTRKLEGQMDEIKVRKRKLLEAMVYQQTLTRAEFDEMRIPLEQELAEAENYLCDARLNEIEIDSALDFAEDLMLNAAAVWERCSLNLKQRLQQVLFPGGVEYANGIYRTQQTGFLLKNLEQVKGEEVELVALTGIEPVFED